MPLTTFGSTGVTDTSSNHALPVMPLRTYALTWKLRAAAGMVCVMLSTFVQNFVPFTPPA